MQVRGWAQVSSQSQLDTVLSYIEKGKAEGANLLFGGNEVVGKDGLNGYYVEPTVFEGVTSKMVLAQRRDFRASSCTYESGYDGRGTGSGK